MEQFARVLGLVVSSLLLTTDQPSFQSKRLQIRSQQRVSSSVVSEKSSNQRLLQMFHRASLQSAEIREDDQIPRAIYKQVMF